MSDESDTSTDASTESAAGIETGDRYRLTDDGTVFEVVGVTDDEVDVIQYDDTGDSTGEYTTSIEEFRRDVVGPTK